MHIQRIVLLLSVASLLVGCRSNRTRGESRVCEVHHARMSKTTVPLQYGLPAFDARDIARYPASTNAFPHAEEWVGGGCIRPLFPYHRAVIYTCDACKTARQQWEHDYDTKR
jgi:hypothetical protein